MNRMNILFVTQFFYPENFRINDMAKRLVSRGHNVTVLTGEPNYPQGNFFEGYSAFSPRREMWEGVNIIRVPVIPRKSGSKWLCLNYLSFIISGCLKAMKMKVKHYDVIYAFGTSPITQAIPGIVVKKRTGKGLILNVQDLWPDNVIAITGLKNKKIIGLIDKMVDYIYNRCDYVLGTSHSFVDAIRNRKGLKNKDKVLYYPQYSVVKDKVDFDDCVINSNDEFFHVVFTGNVGEGQGLDTVIEAAKDYKKNGDKICFDIVGDGRARARLESDCDKYELGEYVRFHGSFPEERIPGILGKADAALLILNNNPIFEKTIPAKLQTYLSCGCPIFGCVSGESRQLIEDNEVGICSDEVSFSGALKSMSEMPKERLNSFSDNALELSDREFDAHKLIERLEGLMESLGR